MSTPPRLLAAVLVLWRHQDEAAIDGQSPQLDVVALTFVLLPGRSDAGPEGLVAFAGHRPNGEGHNTASVQQLPRQRRSTSNGAPSLAPHHRIEVLRRQAEARPNGAH